MENQAGLVRVLNRQVTTLARSLSLFLPLSSTVWLRLLFLFLHLPTPPTPPGTALTSDQLKGSRFSPSRTVPSNHLPKSPTPFGRGIVSGLGKELRHCSLLCDASLPAMKNHPLIGSFRVFVPSFLKYGNCLSDLG